MCRSEWDFEGEPEADAFFREQQLGSGPMKSAKLII
jgi:hypothetical protein